jgi:hypothetical protein
MKIGDLVRVHAPVDRYADASGRARRSVTLWDNEYLTYGNGRFPVKGITVDDIMLVLNKRLVTPENGLTANRMVKVLSARGEVGWILESNLEVIP